MGCLSLIGCGVVLAAILGLLYFTEPGLLWIMLFAALVYIAVVIFVPKDGNK